MHDSFTLLQAFIEGLILVFSPCVLPLLPLILSSTATGSKARPFGVILGFILAFSTFTLLAHHAVGFLGIDPQWLQYTASALLFLFGLILISETLSNQFAQWSSGIGSFGQRLAQKSNRTQTDPLNDFLSGLLLGSCIGLIWTPCAGPVLAAVIVQIIVQESTLQGALTVIAFSLGVGIPMLLIARGGQWLTHGLPRLKEHSMTIRRGFGIAMILTILWTLNQQGVFSQNLFGFELPFNQPNQSKSQTITGLQHGLAKPIPAPEIQGITHWLNSEPLTLKDLKGKVVLVDFWTYSCINCVRTLPHITDWYNKYKDQGLVIIGVHAPEFPFERERSNVERAMTQHHINYPVAMDNGFVTWRNYSNRYWPAHYLIDRSGKIVYTHFGEGQYDMTENNIRYLLGLKTATDTNHPENNTAGIGQTPETYLGYQRAMHFKSDGGLKADQISTYTMPKFLPLHNWGFSGQWQVSKQKSVAKTGSALQMNFFAKKVFLVMGTESGKPVKAQISLNGSPLTPQAGAGKDVNNGQIIITNHTIYELVDLDQRANGLLEIQAESPGLEVYAFTFGS